MKKNRQKPTVIKANAYRSVLPKRLPQAHKGLFGHVLIIGGELGMGGAVCLAGEAALRIGAGRVSIATRKEHIAAILSRCPEIMAHGVEQMADMRLLLANATVIVIGPGLGQTRWSKRLFNQALLMKQSKVIDADGLNLLAKQAKKSAHWILTPHPGEAAHLIDSNIETIQTHRPYAIQQLRKTYGGVIVLKGFHSLIAAKGSLRVCKAGNPGMASSGMGDVLSGVIGGLVAQGLSLTQAAEFGVYLHATAGDLAAAKKGERGLLASDLMPFLHTLANKK